MSEYYSVDTIVIEVYTVRSCTINFYCLQIKYVKTEGKPTSSANNSAVTYDIEYNYFYNHSDNDKT